MKRFFLKNAIVAVSISAVLLTGTSFSAAPAQTQPRQLSFAERVAYQYAIEEVYWRHRIWPKENPGPKPPLDEMMSAAQIEKKVADYLRNSQLLADYWQRPITPEHLQAEMERMASETKQPEVLQELFAALGNDSLVIAECLARSILSERMVAYFTDTTLELSGTTWRDLVEFVEGSPARSPNFAQSNSPSRYKLPRISVPADCMNNTWVTTTTTNAPAGRSTHTAVWTGSEMIIWANAADSARYNPSTDNWVVTTTNNAPSTRSNHTAIWTGTEMIIWGGISGGQYPTIGGRYNPSADSWTATTTTNAPSGRRLHTAVWTGTEMIAWGGWNGTTYLNTGGRYKPSTDSWVATANGNVPSARIYYPAVWTGTEMVVWGGFDGSTFFNTGGRYNPSTDSWIATTTNNAPAARDAHAAVWTGSEMVVWGGFDGSIQVNGGGRYNPNTDSWVATTIANAPSARYWHTAIWTGSEMIVWGGYPYTNTGGRYYPITDSWFASSAVNAPAGRQLHTAVWTGSEMIVWGGYDGNTVNTGGRYCAQSAAPVAQSAVSRRTHGLLGMFDVDLPLAGTPGIECRAGGATNDYSMVVTFASAVTVNGSPQAQVTSGTGTVGSGGVSNGGMVTISGNSVIVPLTNVSNAQTINVRLNGVTGSSGSGNITVPMSILIGDTNANAAVNSGDVAQTKARLGQALDATNFRSDVNANGAINAGDVSQIKSLLGTGLP